MNMNAFNIFQLTTKEVRVAGNWGENEEKVQLPEAKGQKQKETSSLALAEKENGHEPK